MKTLLTGATGYLGSAIARQLTAQGVDFQGLARSPENVARLTAAGITPYEASIDDIGQHKAIAGDFDAIILGAAMDLGTEGPLMRSLLDALRGSGKLLVYTSGTGVLGIDAKDGSWDENSFAEDDPFPFPAVMTRQARLPTEEMVRAAADDGVRAMVVRPPLLYGHGGSSQVPAIFESARITGRACYIGKGLNLYSNVHVDDAAAVFPLAMEKGVAGAVYHAVGGEADYRSIAEAVAEVLDCETESVSFERACEIWHPMFAAAGLAVNSRSRAPRTRRELGWVPVHDDLIEDIRHGSYRAAYGAPA